MHYFQAEKLQVCIYSFDIEQVFSISPFNYQQTKTNAFVAPDLTF